MRIKSTGDIAIGVEIFDDNGIGIDIPIHKLTLEMETAKPIKIIMELPIFDIDIRTDRSIKCDNHAPAPDASPQAAVESVNN